MGRVFTTVQECNAALDLFLAHLHGQIQQSLDEQTDYGFGFATRVRIFGGRQDTRNPPPNPPPGALLNRSGKLRSGYFRTGVSTRTFGGGRHENNVFGTAIGVDLSRVRYGRIHELGGRAGHGALIPKRPVLGPTRDELAPILIRDLTHRAHALIRRMGFD